MRTTFAIAFSLILFASSFSRLVAEDSPIVDPFKSPTPGNRVVSASVSDAADATEKAALSLPHLALPKLPKPNLPKLKMPKMSMPRWTKRGNSPRTGPSTWDKLNSGTKNMFAKTRDTLMPWASKKKPTVRRATGSRTRVASNRSNRNNGSSSEKKSLFSSLLPAPAPEENRIETTSDFLRQPRP
jgi:hypothetical protein